MRTPHFSSTDECFRLKVQFVEFSYLDLRKALDIVFLSKYKIVKFFLRLVKENGSFQMGPSP